MEKPIVFMFSGQGSQYYQMGKELYDRNPIFRKWMDALDGIAKTITAESVLEQLYDERKRKDEAFDRTLYSHPAIFMVEYALAQTLLETGIEPDFVLGTSMGEFAAAAVAGIISIEDSLEMLLKQAELFEAHCQKGSMLAILHDSKLYQDDPLIYETSELVSINFDTHFIVSGSQPDLGEIKKFLQDENITCHSLPVSYAFHSAYMDPAEQAYTDFLSTKAYRKPEIPFVSGMDGHIKTELPSDYFWDVVRKPIRFANAVHILEDQQSYYYLDLGPTGTLANFSKRLISESSSSVCYGVLSPFNQDPSLTKVKALITN